MYLPFLLNPQVRMGDEDDYVCEVNLKDAPIRITHHLEVLGECYSDSDYEMSPKPSHNSTPTCIPHSRSKPVVNSNKVDLLFANCRASPLALSVIFAAGRQLFAALPFPIHPTNVQICGKICWLGCVNRMCARVRLTQPSPHIFLHFWEWSQ